MRVIAIVNQKGGVGKTTTAVNLAHALARRDNHVTVIDLDPQGHLLPSFGVFGHEESGISKVLGENAELSSQVMQVRPWCTLVPSGAALAELEQLSGTPERAYRLRNALERSEIDSDYVLIDCPPSSGMLMVNAIAAADDILIPVPGDYLSLTGLARLMLTLKRLRRLSRPGLRQWIFSSRFMPRRRLAREVYGKLHLHFPNHLLHASVTEAAALAECAGTGQTIFEYRPRSRSAQEFDALADDLLNERIVAYGEEKTSDVA